MRKQNLNKALLEKVENKLTGAFLLLGLTFVGVQVVRILVGV